MNDPSTGSVTGWLQAVRTGDEGAATDLWARYFHRVAGLARKRLLHDVEYDGDDLAVSVFDMFFRELQEGRHHFDDRDDFWSLLVVVAIRKANDRRKHVQAAKRRILGDPLNDADQTPSGDPPPDLALVMAEECESLLNALADPELEQAALLKLDGYSNQEIADQMDCSVRTVGRMLNLIRTVWENRSGSRDRDGS